MKKSYEEINEKIRQGKAVVLTAEEVSQLARTLSPAEIVRRVDVVTTGTFGAMCSSAPSSTSATPRRRSAWSASSSTASP